MATSGMGQERTTLSCELSDGRLQASERGVARFWITAPLVLLDAIGIVAGMVAAYYVRFHLLPYYSTFSPVFYVRLIALAVPAWLAIFALYRLYDDETLFGGTKEYGAVINACTAGLVMLTFYEFLDEPRDAGLSRGWLGLAWLFSVMSTGALRFGYRRFVYAMRRRGHFLRHVLVVGANPEGTLVAQQLQDVPTGGFKVVGFVNTGSETEELAPGSPPILGDLEALPELIRRLRPEELLVIPTALNREALLDIYRDWGTDPHMQLRLSSGLYELFTTGVHVRDAGYVSLVSINRTRITGVDAWMKTALDYLGAIVLLILLLPLFLIVALAIALDSPGGVFHRRRVIGLNGREFHAFKFRTMRSDADAFLAQHPELKAEWDAQGKVRDDPRITRVGRLLRRFSIDELPQLLNVLVGQMSLVGPRMITPEELARFGCWQHNLLTVKPGMTGLWQVSGRADLSYDARVELDMRYIRNYTVWLDAKIMFSTLFVVLSGRGAY